MPWVQTLIKEELKYVRSVLSGQVRGFMTTVNSYR